ncbi:hypothetical protein B0T22DRAFT_491740 [Podospora appendiculata]|uniref:Uncharacterized protein n=1 Tax=Podospora appendiculata TaxID=314037 RepID=A0AAE0XDV8_9PEZI|nr:hypothetical protein B0T22DRAFT_491740 [Podospora appendiculata]
MKSFSAALAAVAILSLGTVLASPVATGADAPAITEAPSAKLVKMAIGNHKGTAFNGALDPTSQYRRSTKPADGVLTDPLTPGPATMTISLFNKAGVDLTTYRSDGQVTGIVKAGDFGVALYPAPWEGGMISINQAKYPADFGDESLIEGSYKAQPALANGAFPVSDIDVSYVDGFSFPIMCYCGDDGSYMSGCDKPLWSMNPCPTNNGLGSCKNPKRDDDARNVTPDPFFAPCQGLAYTYPMDSEANSNGFCQSGTYLCDVLPNGGLDKKAASA